VPREGRASKKSDAVRVLREDRQLDYIAGFAAAKLRLGYGVLVAAMVEAVVGASVVGVVEGIASMTTVRVLVLPQLSVAT